MTTTIVRRLYIYAAALIGLQLLAVGARGLLTVLLEAVVSAAAIGSAEDRALRVSLYTALMLVGVPLWAGHWRWAQRLVRQPDEQHSALRRLYGYAVLLIAMLGLLFAIRALIGTLLQALLDAGTLANIAAPTATIVVNGALWLYHWRVLGADRGEVERGGAVATLRRWYLVLVLAFSLGLGTVAAGTLLHHLLELIVAPPIGQSEALPQAVAGLLAGLAIWLPHHAWGHALARQQTPLGADELRSTLRQVYGALVFTVALIAALGGFTTLLYWVLLASFGGATWRSVAVEHTQAVSVVVVALGVWQLHRLELAADARRSSSVARSATARRVIGYLTAAVGLVALFFGLGGLLSTLLRLLLAPATLGTAWRDSVSLGLALSLVALPVYAWAARGVEHHVRATPDEDRALARRIYLYGALLFGIVVTLVALVAVLRLVIGAMLGTTEPDVAAEVGSWLGFAVVGATIGGVYVLLLRRGIAARAKQVTPQTVAILAEEPLRTALATTISRELAGVQLRIIGSEQAVSVAEQLASTDTLVLSLAAALDARVAKMVQAFPGRRLVLATAAPGYQVIGGRTDEAMLRAVVRALSGDAKATAPAAAEQPVTAPGSAS